MMYSSEEENINTHKTAYNNDFSSYKIKYKYFIKKVEA